jgi:hypothetical protein
LPFVPEEPLAVAKVRPRTSPVTKPCPAFVTVITAPVLEYVAATGAVVVSKMSSVPAVAVPIVGAVGGLAPPAKNVFIAANIMVYTLALLNHTNLFHQQ